VRRQSIRRHGSACSCRGQPQGPLITGERPIFTVNKNAKRTHQQQTTTTAQLRPTAQQAAGLSTPRAILRLARGARCYTTKTPPRSRAGRPFARDSASLEPHVGPPPPARDAAPALPTRALNARARRGRPGQERILATLAL
jgi:hypothetical protein